MQSQLEELLPFLHDRNPQVRQLALSNLIGYTPKGAQYRHIFLGGSGGLGKTSSNSVGVFRDLKLLCQDQPAIAHDAFRALINLSDSALVVSSLIDVPFLTFLVSYILNPSSVLADLGAMLLSNITVNPTACATLVTLTVPVVPLSDEVPPYYPTASRSATSTAPSSLRNTPETPVLALPLLIDAFVDGARIPEAGQSVEKKRKAELHFLATVFANISTISAGRMFFLTPSTPEPLLFGSADPEYPLAKLIVFTEHKDTIRRGGVVSTIKNCAFHAPAHRAMLSPEDITVGIPPSEVLAPGVNVLPAILLPLAGPEEYDIEDQDLLHPSLQFLPLTKTREIDPVLRLTHIESLLLFCTTYWGRQHLRDNGTYQIVRTMHETEEDDKVAEHIERLVNLLKSDETEHTKNTDDIHHDREAHIEEAEDDITEV